MKTKRLITILLTLFTLSNISAQHLALPIQDADKQGLSILHLDSIYMSAVHSDTSLTVFKTEKQQQKLGEAYMNMLQDLGKFLTKNNFIWDKPTRGFNRIYFKEDGTIDYFLFSFQTKNVNMVDQLSEEKKTEFNRLLTLFIKDYKFPLRADRKFAQCSPTTYMPKESK